MKIVILSTARSGSTWLYHTLMQYVAPQQTELETTGIIFDEVFGSKQDIEHIQRSCEYIINQPNWVVKVLIEDVHTQAKDLLSQLIKHSDRTVKLVRDPAQKTFSRLIAIADDQWHGKEYRLKQLPEFTDEQVFNHTKETIITTIALDYFPCDVCIDYAEMQYPRQIYSIATGIDINSIKPMRDTHYKKTHYEYNRHQVNELARRIERAAENFDITFGKFLTINQRVAFDRINL